MSTDADIARPHIVVGVDGSSESVKATAWAAEQARATGGTLELLIVWARPMSYGLPLVVGGYNPEHEAQDVVEKAASGIDLPAQRLRTSVVERSPGRRAGRALEERGPPRRGIARARRVCGDVARVSQRSLRSPRELPGGRRPIGRAPGVKRKMRLDYRVNNRHTWLGQVRRP